MKKILILFIMLSSMSVLADMPDIIALVNDQPITKYDFKSRKNMIVTLNKIDISDQSQEILLNNEILNILIQEEIVNQHAENIGVLIDDKDIDRAIANIESSNNMPRNSMINDLKQQGINIESFRRKIKSDLISNEILGALSDSVLVSENEVDVALVHNSNKDFNIEAWIFTAKENTDKDLLKMQKLKKNLISCDKINKKLYEDFADAKKIDYKLRKLSDKTQSVVLDTKVASTSKIYKEDDKFKLILLCKKDKVISKDDLMQVETFLSNQKVSQKAQKFFRDLRAKADVRMMIPG